MPVLKQKKTPDAQRMCPVGHIIILCLRDTQTDAIQYTAIQCHYLVPVLKQKQKSEIDLDCECFKNQSEQWTLNIE